MAPNESPARSYCGVTLPTPDGPFTIVTSDRGILASGWAPDASSLLPLIHASLRPSAEQLGAYADPDQNQAGPAAPCAAQQRAIEAARALADYYAGDLDAPARVPVVQQSGPFRETAWEVLREVTPGQPVTYTEYAARAGRPAAVRAAASACAMNAAALFVPCHRVLRSDGSLGGFRYGLAMKERLLARETPAAA